MCWERPQFVDLLLALEAPEADRSIGSAGGEGVAIGRELNRTHRCLVAGELRPLLWLAAVEVIRVDQAVEDAGRQQFVVLADVNAVDGAGADGESSRLDGL